MSDESPPSPVELRIPWATIGKVLAAVLLAVIAVRLWPLFQLLILALLVAIALWPLLRWSAERGWPKWVGFLLAALLLTSFVVLFFGLMIPMMSTQAVAIIENLPKFRESVMGKLPASGALRDTVNHWMNSASFSNPEPLMKNFVAWGKVALGGVMQLLVMLVIAVYLLADGERVYRWLLAFLPRTQRRKVAEAAPEIASLVSAYVVGQFITSLLCAVFVFGLLSLLRVPNALLLGVLAGLLDVLPLIGFFLSVLPAAGVAFSVSPSAALIVVVAFTAYNLVENYFIVPKVYGNRLRLSTLTVLLACLAGGMLTGVPGAIAILPLVASYPVIERIWLQPHLEPDTVQKHEAIDEQEHPTA